MFLQYDGEPGDIADLRRSITADQANLRLKAFNNLKEVEGSLPIFDIYNDDEFISNANTPARRETEQQKVEESQKSSL